MIDIRKTNKLTKSFYQQPTEIVAEKLLGKLFVKKLNNELIISRIVETEAYLYNDEASHSFNGKSNRNKSMFQQGGILYVYRIYGIHFCCNVVTGKKNIGEAVLIRAVEPLEGIEKMISNRGKKIEIKDLTNGPAKLCKSYSITNKDDGINLLGNDIYILDDTFKPDKITKTTRIGITKAADLPLRFYIAENRFVSKK